MQVQQITLPSQYALGAYTPALDTTGVLSANLVDGEIQAFNANSASAYTFIIPSYAPFFTEGVEVLIKNNLNVYVPLTLGIDYSFVYPFLGASRAIDQPVYGGIRFNNISALTSIRLHYQSLGGNWVMTPEQIAAILLGEVRHPGIVALEQVTNYAGAFPVVTSAWDRQDGVSMVQVNSEIDSLTTSIKNRQAARDYSTPSNHLLSRGNPHGVTATQVGLGLVSNLPAAGVSAGQDSTNNSAYISSAQVNSMMKNWLKSASATQQGVAKLNLGINQGDDSDSSAALTAAGFTNIVSNTSSAINQAYNKGQLSSVVTPFPFTYPIRWNSVQYANKAAFVAAVEALVNVSPLEYNEQNGTFWFPANITLPDLTITQL